MFTWIRERMGSGMYGVHSGKERFRTLALMVTIGFRSFFIVVLSACCFGCEENVTAVVGTGRPFTLYGLLTPQLDTQWVRVFNVEDRLAPSRPTILDATFITTDLTLNTSREWKDSIVTDLNQQFSHVFWSNFQPEYGHTYRIEVTRSDGARTSAEVTVPPLCQLIALPADVGFRAVSWPVRVDCDAPRLNRIEVIYSIDYKPLGQEPLRNVDITLPYDGRQVKSPDGWIIPIDLYNDRNALQDQVIRVQKRTIDSGFGIVLVGLSLQLIVANKEWEPPGGVFDPEVLVQPEVMSNMVNGYGFVGAGYRLTLRSLPPDSVTQAAGFGRSQP